MKRSALNRTVLTLVSIFILGACSPAGQDKQVYNRSTGLTILGLDGATWEIIDPLIERGDLPGFKRLKENGSWGKLETFIPTESVSIWTSIATGVSPTKHGVQTFTRRLPGEDTNVPSPGTDRLVPAIWNIASQQQKSVVVAKWFATWPAEEVNGAMLSPRLEAQDEEPRTYPLDLFKEIDPFRHQTTQDQLPQPPKKSRQLNRIMNQHQTAPANPNAPPMLIGQDQVKTRMFDDTTVWKAAKYTYDKYSPDLFMVYLKSTDRVEHFLWGAHEVSNPDTDQKAEAEVIYGWYRYYDGIIQELLNDPSRTLMVVSDHGMQARDSISEPYHIFDLDYDLLLSRLNYLTRNGRSTVWSSTRLYTWRSLPYDNSVVFRINMKDREPEGIVEPNLTADLVPAITNRLQSLITSSGTLFFESVTYSEQEYAFRCKVARNVKISDELLLEESSIKLADAVIRKGLPRGIHTDAPPGIIAIHGPNVAKNQILETAHVFDITPTALYLMNLPVADDFDGKPLTDAIAPDVKNKYRRKRITSYGRRYTETHLKQSSNDDKMLDELRALGYIN